MTDINVKLFFQLLRSNSFHDGNVIVTDE